MLKMISTRAAMLLLAISPLAAQAVPPLPFKAVLQTKETLGLDPQACAVTPFLQGTTSGSGRASYLGDVAARATDCITPADGSYVFSGGQLVITAANGDTLTMDYDGTLTPTANYPVFAISGSYRISGGTGRFRGATGAGTLQGSSNIATGAGVYSATGSIAY